jgi:hypothetical protein
LNVSAEISNIVRALLQTTSSPNFTLTDLNAKEARNISIIQGNNIAFIKTYPGGSGYVTNITFENFRSLASLYGLNINQYWQNTFTPDTGSVALSNILFKNFSGKLLR